MTKQLAAEFFGTFWLVFAGCGVATLTNSSDFGVAAAYGIAVLTMSYAVGTISGGHFNPAVTFGLVVAGRFDWLNLVPYWAAQLLGGIAGAYLLTVIAADSPYLAPVLDASGYRALSPGHYGLPAALLSEVTLTALFLIVFLGANAKSAALGFAPLAIGLTYALIYLFSIPVTDGAANPARATAAALFGPVGSGHELWAFWVAPLAGAALGAIIWVRLIEPKSVAKV